MTTISFIVVVFSCFINELILSFSFYYACRLNLSPRSPRKHGRWFDSPASFYPFFFIMVASNYGQHQMHMLCHLQYQLNKFAVVVVAWKCNLLNVNYPVNPNLLCAAKKRTVTPYWFKMKTAGGARSSLSCGCSFVTIDRSKIRPW